MDKARFRTRVNLSLAFSCFRALDGEAGDEERRGVSLLSVGQAGAKHRRLVCASLLQAVYAHL